MKERLEAIKAAALAKINEADMLTSLNDVKVSVLGKRGTDTGIKRYERCSAGGQTKGWTDGK